MTYKLEDHARMGADHVAEIVAAYVSNNHVAPGDLPALIACVQTSFAGLADGRASGGVQPKVTLTPDQIRKSITRDALISFIDGKGYKALRRHLTSNGIDPQTYRQRYGLPADYPMVAPTYSERRSEISKGIISRRHGHGRLSSTTRG